MENIFERSEKKYLLTQTQYKRFIEKAGPLLTKEFYDTYSINNLYYDTDAFDLIRHSIDKPPYKEKLRIRSYGDVKDDSIVFIELKKKYNRVVFKRRIECTLSQTKELLAFKNPLHGQDQIVKEIHYFLQYYKPKPKVFLAYDRHAFHALNDTALRITFDMNIRYRQDHLTLYSDALTTPYFHDNQVLMEIKVLKALPLWLTTILSQLEIYPISFSKYGRIYSDVLEDTLRKEIFYV